MTDSGHNVTVGISRPDMIRLRDLGESICEIGERFPTPAALVEACVLYALDEGDPARLSEYARERKGAQ